MTDAWDSDDEGDKAVNKALGKELRACRDAAGLSRAKLVKSLPFRLHIQTLQNYELGLRQIPLGKLEVIARALHSSAEELVGKAVRVAESRKIRVIDVDLQALRGSQVDESDLELSALQRWAHNRPASGGVARISWAIVLEIAAAVGLSAGGLAKRLEGFRLTSL